MATTPYAYAKAELAAERFPQILIIGPQGGRYYLHDSQHYMLDAQAFGSRDAAEQARTKVLDRARKAHWKNRP